MNFKINFKIVQSLKMRRTISVLVLFRLLFLIISVFSQKSKNIIESDSNLTRNYFRAGKYNSLLWAPSDITVTFNTKHVRHHENNGLSRVQIEENPIHRKLLPASLSLISEKSRAIESFERKHSGKVQCSCCLG